MSDDLVKRLREDQPVTQDMTSTLQCALQDAAADRIEELEAKLAKAVELALTKAAVNLRTYAPSLVDGPEHDVGYYYGYHTALGRILDLLAELKGQDYE